MRCATKVDFLLNGSFAGLADANGALVQGVYLCEPSGHIVGSLDTYVLWVPWSVGVAAARTTHLDLFHASGSGQVMRVRSIRAVPDVVTAVTGVGFRWELIRTNTVGTGGTALTAQKTDTGFANLAAQITARAKPTGGAATQVMLFGFSVHGEETNVSNLLAQYHNLLDEPLVLREGFGFKLDQVTNSVAGNFGWLVTFTTETA